MSLSREDFIVMRIWLILKSLKENYQTKKSFIVRQWLTKLVIKSMSMFLMFGTILKTKRWNTIITCTSSVMSYY